MRTRNILWPLCVLSTLCLVMAFGCGGEDGQDGQDGPVNSNEAAVVQKASSNAVGTLVQTSMLPELQSFAAGGSAAAWLDGELDNFNLDGALDNPLGGSIGFTGNGALGVGTGFVDLGFKASLNDWLDQETGATLKGALDITVTVKSFAPVEVNVKLKGDLQVSGTVQAKVPIDLSMDLLTGGALTCGTVSALDVNLDQCGAAITSQAASAIQLSVVGAAQQLQALVLAETATLGIPGLGGGSAAVNGSINGSAGGSVDYSGSVSSGQPGSFKTDISLTFNGWQDAGVLPLDGKLQITQELNPPAVKSAVNGSLTINGTAAAVDIQIDVDSDDPDGVSVCGTIAGHTVATGICKPQ